MRDVRRGVIVVLLAATSAFIAQWRPALQRSQKVVSVARLVVPPIFTGVGAAGPVAIAGTNNTSCKMTPDPSNGGQLTITLKGISIFDTNNNEVKLLTGDASLNFAKNPGDQVGNFINGVPVPNGTYTSMKVTVGPTLTILCSAHCDPGDGGGTRDWFTSTAKTALTDDDVNVGPATAAAITIGNGNTPFTVNIVPALTVTNNSASTLSVYFNNASACQLHDVSSLKGHAALTDLKILPALPAPTKVQ